MRTITLFLTLVAFQAPTRPDLSGEWVMDPTKTSSTGAPMRVGGPAASAALGTVTEPRKIKHVNPVYPAVAQRAQISGFIVMEAVISRTGKVQDLRVLRSIPALDDAALKAVSQWEYTPTLVAGVPVEVIMTVTVNFTLTGTTPQMGVSVGGGSMNWPSQPAGAARPGMGRGFTAPEITLKQDAESLTMIRRFADANEEIRYRFDGQPVRNRLPGTGGAVDNTYIYTSRWDGPKLVTTINWTGPQGPRERTETISIEGDVLTIQNSRAATAEGAEPFVTTNVFGRKK